jgi:hypothetical protein
VPVPLIYLDEKRSFGGSLDDGRKRIEYYHRVLDRSIAQVTPPSDHEPDCLFDIWDDSACRLPCGQES